jgi:hypothetical protein
MINIEQAVNNKFPIFANQPSLIRKPTLSLLKRLIHEDEINSFLERHKNAKGFGFIDKVFDHFDFSYSVRASDRKNIPAIGRVVIFANHNRLIGRFGDFEACRGSAPRCTHYGE